MMNTHFHSLSSGISAAIFIRFVSSAVAFLSDGSLIPVKEHAGLWLELNSRGNDTKKCEESVSLQANGLNFCHST